MKYIFVFVFMTLNIFVFGQKIGVDLTIHQNGLQQYGIVIEDVIDCTGFYYNRLAKETYNSDHYLNRGTYETNGFAIGLTHTVLCERVSFVSLGYGSLITHRFDTNKTIFWRKTSFFEAKTGILLTHCCDLIFGFACYTNTAEQPISIMSGLRFKIILTK